MTGQLFIPTIYRRLLDAYAPQRKPSTVTLADERRRLAELLAVVSRVDHDEPADAHANLLHLIRAAVTDALEVTGPVVRAGASEGSAELAFLRSWVDEAEAMVRQLRAHAAEIAAQLAVSQYSAAQYQDEAQRLHCALGEQTAAIGVFSIASDDARKFAMLAIDEARGETRMWKERCLALEGQRRGAPGCWKPYARQPAVRAAKFPPPYFRTSPDELCASPSYGAAPNGGRAARHPWPRPGRRRLGSSRSLAARHCLTRAPQFARDCRDIPLPPSEAALVLRNRGLLYAITLERAGCRGLRHLPQGVAR